MNTIYVIENSNRVVIAIFLDRDDAIDYVEDPQNAWFDPRMFQRSVSDEFLEEIRS